MRGQVRRRRWRAVALEIDRRGHHRPAQLSHPARHQRDIGDVAGPHRQVQPILDHVGELIADDQFDPQSRMARRQHRQTRRKKPRTGHRYADAHQPRQRPALPPQRGLHLLGAFQQVTGMAEQRLAIVGQAEASRRTVEQAHLEMLFQRRDLTGHRRLAGVRLPRDSRERAGLGHPDKCAQSADQVHDFPTLRKDEFQESRIIFPRQEVYLMPIAIRDSTADLPRSDRLRSTAPARQRKQTEENDDEDHDACRGCGACAWRRLRLCRRGQRHGCQHLLHPVAWRGCPGTEPAGAERGRPEPGRRAHRCLRHEPQHPGPGCSRPTRATADQTVATDAEGAGPKPAPFRSGQHAPPPPVLAGRPSQPIGPFSSSIAVVRQSIGPSVLERRHLGSSADATARWERACASRRATYSVPILSLSEAPVDEGKDVGACGRAGRA